MNDEVWVPWLTLSSAPHCLSLFLTYSLPLGAHGPAQPLPPSPSPDTAASLCAQVPVYRYGKVRVGRSTQQHLGPF